MESFWVNNSVHDPFSTSSRDYEYMNKTCKGNKKKIERYICQKMALYAQSP